MATAKQIYELLNDTFPFSTREAWDNSGLLIDSGRDSGKILICLDVTHAVVDRAIETGAKVILSHHPVIFAGVKSISAGDVVYRLVKNDISVISAHTNFDKYEKGTCYRIAEKLDFSPVYNRDIEIGLAAKCEKTTCRQLAEKCKKIFGGASFTLPEKNVENIFICAGSGSGMMTEILATGADLFITGESKYHDMLDLASMGVAVIETGHDASEKISLETFEQLIKDNFSNLKTEIFMADNLQIHI